MLKGAELSMDKSAIKNFAIEARKMLMKSAETEAGFYGVTKNGCKNPIQKGNDFEVYETIAGTENRIYGGDIKKRANLVKAVEMLGFEQVIEETAYTWFNRIIAIRFMEVNDYLPTRVRVLSSETGSNTPDIVTQSLDVDLNMTPEEVEKVQKAKDENRYDDAFRMLFIKQCNELNAILPGLFEKTDDYMELLLKLSYTSDGVVRMLVDSIDENNFNVETEGQVEIIGWMYQYYNTELKAEVFGRPSGTKIKKEDIPAATQLFTPDWIVRYMVENSVGRVWIEHLRALDSSVDEKAKAEEFGWKYYLPEAEQEEKVNQKLIEIRKDYLSLEPKDISCIDPCMGSGHILVYMFDVLMDIYKSEGFSERDATFSILENNIHGLDIDKRAYQLSYFALMMKARGYNRTFFRGKQDENGERVFVEPVVFAIEESNDVNRNQLKYFGADMSENEKNKALNQMSELLDCLKDAKEYGSILEMYNYEWKLLEHFVMFENIEEQISLETLDIDRTKRILSLLVKQGKVMANKYLVVSTNPPYFGVSNTSSKLNAYVKRHYADYKEDLYAVFIAKVQKMTKEFGYFAMITQHSWMFLSRSQEIRYQMLHQIIVNMAHIGARGFEEIAGEVVQTTAFVVRKICVNNYVGTYERLVNGINQQDKERIYLERKNEILFNQQRLYDIPGYIYAYWISDNFINNFSCPSIGEVLDCRVGLDTGNNDKYLRLWYEVELNKIKFDAESLEEVHSIVEKKYVPHTKGGSYRKWQGNLDYVIAFDNANYNELLNSGNHLPSRQFYFKKGLTWTRVSSKFAVRYAPVGCVFNSACPTAFCDDKLFYYSLGLLNSKVVEYYAQLLSPTINFQAGDIGKIPFVFSEDINENVTELVKENVLLSEKEYNAKETSWNFKRHPLIGKQGEKLEDLYYKWCDACSRILEIIRKNEEELNKIFIELYGLREELDSYVAVEDVSLQRPELKSDIRGFVSYVVGCMFGRYSLDVEGLCYAGGEWDENNYHTFLPDNDGIIPITDADYFNDDIVSRFIEFVKVVYGEKNLEENLDFIANALGNKGSTSREIIRNYFINDFYKDHCNMYSVTGSGKRPIYWLFDSGKQNGFKCLIYMHRYNKDTLNLIRSEYLHKTEDAVENALKNAEYIIQTSASAVEKAKATKDRDKYVKQLNEMRIYYQALSHLALQKIEIDLDDGVKHNYQLFQGIEVIVDGGKKQKVDLLAKI